MNRWQQPENQNNLWNDGSYNYQLDSLVPIKFMMTKFFIEKEFGLNSSLSILDIGAGSGEILRHLSSTIKKYYYCDISETATSIFKDTLTKLTYTGEIEIYTGNIENINFKHQKFDTILCLGGVANAITKEYIKKLFFDILLDGGIFILESTNSDFNKDYFYPILPKYKYGIDYILIDDKISGLKYNRMIRVFKK